MPFPEGDNHPGLGSFQPEIRYSQPFMSPEAIATGTSDIFSLYFDYKLPHFDVASDYLRRYTLVFVDVARAGLAAHPERIDRIGNASLEDLTRAGTIDRPSSLPDDETLEVLDHTLVTMSVMPEMVVRQYKDIEGNDHIIEFSRRGLLAPPRTLNETRERIREIWRETLKIAQQTTSPNVDFFKMPEITRTIAFFDIARRIPLRNASMEKQDSQFEALEALAEKFENPKDR